nr:hypothetical protein [Tanacetum cinerariifolium]
DLRPTLYGEKVIGLGNLNTSYVNEKINFEDGYFQEIINPDFEKIDSPFQQTSSLRPYIPNVIIEKIIIDLEDEVVSLLEKEKANMETTESLKSKSFESSENVSSELENQIENDCLVVEKEYEKEENPKVIAPGMFKLNVSQCFSPISMSKSSCDSNNVEIKLKRKRRKRKSSKQNVKQVDNDVSHAKNDCVYFLDLDTFSSVRRPKNSGVIWKKKGSSNTSNVGLSAVSVSNLNKNVKRYSRKDLLACNNSHIGETSSAYMFNDAMNVFCNPRLCDVLDDNNFFIFDDVNVRIYPVSKMPFRKKPRDFMHVRSKIIDSGCSKHMTGNRALFMNFVEKFLGTVRFGNKDFAVIAGYGDVVIGSISIEPANVAEAFRDAHWVSAMKEELNNFARLKVWRLVPRPVGKSVIKTKWIFKNKKDESSLVIRNKARLVAVGYSQQKDHVYALDKALYGLKQEPRAWYDVLSQFFIESGFQKGSIDTTLFNKKG